MMHLARRKFCVARKSGPCSHIWVKTLRTAPRQQQVANHYREVLERIREKGLQAEISVKLTQLGLDLSPELCFEHLNAIIERGQKDSIVWVDMEASNYVDATLDLYRRALANTCQRRHMPAGLSPPNKG